MYTVVTTSAMDTGDPNSYVLVVDDEETIRGFLRRWLEGWGYRVEEAASAAEALEVMNIAPASIAVLDIRMPVHDGLWLAEQLLAKWKQIPIIMTTGGDDVEAFLQTQRFGVVACVMKPFDRDELLQALRLAKARLRPSEG